MEGEEEEYRDQSFGGQSVRGWAPRETRGQLFGGHVLLEPSFTGLLGFPVSALGTAASGGGSFQAP